MDLSERGDGLLVRHPWGRPAPASVSSGEACLRDSPGGSTSAPATGGRTGGRGPRWFSGCAGLFHGLLLPRLAQVAGERFRRRPPTTGVGAWHGGPRVTRAVDTALMVDAGLSRRLSDRGILLPGLSYWALCTKP